MLCVSGDRRRHIKWRAALCKKIDSPAYDMWIEALVKLNDTYIGSKPYNAVDLIDRAYSRTWETCAVGFTGIRLIIPKRPLKILQSARSSKDKIQPHNNTPYTHDIRSAQPLVLLDLVFGGGLTGERG